MSRKRFITSDISTDKKVAALAVENPTAALMWPWLMTNFDDWGRMGADPMEVKLTIFPAFPFTSADIAEAIKLIDKHGLAHYYEVDGKPYLAVNPTTYYKYQTYIKSERKDKQNSKYPAPPNPPWEQEPKNNQQKSAIICDNPQTSATIVLSPSPSPSLSLSKDLDDDYRACAKQNFVAMFEQEFGRTPTPSEAELLKSYLEDGMEEDVLCEAIRRAAHNGVRNTNYVKSILNNLISQQILTMADLKIADFEFEQSKKRNKQDNRVRSPAETKMERNLRTIQKALLEDDSGGGFL